MTTTLRTVSVVLGVIVAASMAGCSCSSPAERNICTLPNPPSGCGAACSSTVPCRAGTHCSAGACTAECSAGHPCPNAALCSSDGTCGAGRDSGPGFDGAHDAAFVLPDTQADTTCAAVTVGTQLATPNVIVVVDQSGSMGSNDFPPGSGTTRWDALEGALMATGGLVDSLQASVRWGMVWFHGGGTCPGVRTVACALNNYSAINTVYMRLAPGGGTPTGEAIDQIVSNPAAIISDPSQPTIIILATDGDPNGCNGDAVAGMASTLTAITNAHNMGISTYVIGVGDATSSNLQMMADAGIGMAGAMWWQPTDTTSLGNALSTIVGGVRSCNLTLGGMLDVSQACTGTVTLMGTPLTCNDPNGWHAVDSTHITLDGNACTALLGGATPLEATFPCGVATPM